MRVLVNGSEARALAANFAEWEVLLSQADQDAPLTLSAFAEDAAGNVEPRPHEVVVPGPGGG